MKKIRYGVAVSLDGYIAGPNGEADWIVNDPAFNFAALWAQFDTLLMGRRTYDAAVSRLGASSMKGRKIVVASRTLRPQDHPGVTILFDVNRESIQGLRAQTRKDIWLFGGGELFTHLLAIKEVDTVEMSVIPVLLGCGIPLMPPPAQMTRLKLTDHKIYPSGTLWLAYDIQ
jgi:dihydrofolate reductase